MITRARQYRLWMVSVAIVWLFWSSMAHCFAYSVSEADPVTDDAVMADTVKTDHSAHLAMSTDMPSQKSGPCAGSPVDNQCESCCDNVPESLLSVDQQLANWLGIVWSYAFAIWQPATTTHTLPVFELSSQHSPPDIFLWICSFLK